MGGGLESRCVGRVYGVDGAVRLQLHQVGISLYFKLKLCSFLKADACTCKGKCLPFHP